MSEERYGIALDIGTSGLRAQGIDLNSGKLISTAITLRHPLPGANIMDHLHFAVETSIETAHSIVIDAVNKLIRELGIDLNRVERLAASGNPTQLSIFQGIEVRDLAFWGKHALERYGVKPPTRDSTIIEAAKLDIIVKDGAEVYIPPSVKHEIGADALAMLYEAKIFEKREDAFITDFGTNAEMALCLNGEIYTGSAAAGPAIEGQRIENGMLASPGAISDVSVSALGWKNYVLNGELIACEGDVVAPSSGKVLEEGVMHGSAVGVTGTGVIAITSMGIDLGLVTLPRVGTPDRSIHLQDGLYVTEKDIKEAGKALGAFRAGYFTLAEEAGILQDDVDTAYMAGASGFYVDAIKSLNVGQIPRCCENIYQVGNTSLALARDIVRKPKLIDFLQDMAKQIRGKHIMFPESQVFMQVYPLELAYWEEGMPLWEYEQWLKKYNYQGFPRKAKDPKVYKIFKRDIPDLGEKGLKIVRDIGVLLVGEFPGCNACRSCETECPEGAIRVEEKDGEGKIFVRSELCLGIACLRCERICPQKVFRFKELLHEKFR
ncbi:MAG: methylamine methyltransferase corrinoid protein reductive activase [archaeon]|nr:methylamine methyltransferase corrinoid protein reductive activase [archaeon]